MRRSLVFLLTLIFVFTIVSGPIAPKADAVVVSSIVVGTVIAAMAAAGIGLTVSGITSSQLSGWVSDKLNGWATSIGGSVQDFIDNSVIGTTAQGIIAVGTSAANGISDFISWLVQDQSLTDNSSVVVFSNNAAIVPVVSSEPTYSYVMDNGLKVFWSREQTRYRAFTVLGNVLNIYYMTAYNNNGFTRLIVATNSSDSYIKLRGAQTWVNNSIDTYQMRATADSTGVYYADLNTNFQEPCFLNKYATYNEALQAALSAVQDGTPSLQLDTTVITVPTIDTNSQDKWFLDVGAAPGTTIETATDGVIADTIEGDLTVSGEVAEEEPEFVIDEPIAISGLSEVFPFCIPFDIYALLSALSADPQTPVFTARFVVPGIIDEEFTIDLTPFNAVAQIVRTMELLAFIIGLALVTRERFLRS